MEAELQSVVECDLARFLESYIFDVVFNPQSPDSVISPELIDYLVVLASGRSPVSGTAVRYMQGVLPSPAACVGILRELSKLSGSSTVTVRECMDRSLVAARESAGGVLDCPFCVAVLGVTEDQIRAESSDCSIEDSIQNWTLARINLSSLCVVKGQDRYGNNGCEGLSISTHPRTIIDCIAQV